MFFPAIHLLSTSRETSVLYKGIYHSVLTTRYTCRVLMHGRCHAWPWFQREFSIIGGSCHKYNFCRDKTRVLSRQKYACRDKGFVATKVPSGQIHVFVATKHVFCRDKSILVINCHKVYLSNTCSSRQIFRDKHNFVAGSILLSTESTDEKSETEWGPERSKVSLTLVECMYHALTRIQVRVAVDDSGLCFCVFVRSFERQFNTFRRMYRS